MEKSENRGRFVRSRSEIDAEYVKFRCDHPNQAEYIIKGWILGYEAAVSDNIEEIRKRRV